MNCPPLAPAIRAIRPITTMSNLPPGPELDALVAEKVMGWTELMIRGGGVPAYSTSIADAWTVVEKFSDFDWKLESHGEGHTFTIYKDATHYCGDADTAPLAICYAALNAAGK